VPVTTPVQPPAATPPQPAPRKEKEKKVFTDDPAAAPGQETAAGPMQRGALIRRGQPNVEEPEPIDLPKYTYPAAAHGSGKTARVRLAVLVDETGKVTEAVVREGDTSGLGFNEAAQEAARKVPYRPATRDGIAGKMWTELIFEFTE
jgi:TonB family protein